MVYSLFGACMLTYRISSPFIADRTIKFHSFRRYEKFRDDYIRWIEKDLNIGILASKSEISFAVVRTIMPNVWFRIDGSTATIQEHSTMIKLLQSIMNFLKKGKDINIEYMFRTMIKIDKDIILFHTPCTCLRNFMLGEISRKTERDENGYTCQERKGFRIIYLQ